MHHHLHRELIKASSDDLDRLAIKGRHQPRPRPDTNRQRLRHKLGWFMVSAGLRLIASSPHAAR